MDDSVSLLALVIIDSKNENILPNSSSFEDIIIYGKIRMKANAKKIIIVNDERFKFIVMTSSDFLNRLLLSLIL